MMVGAEAPRRLDGEIVEGDHFEGRALPARRAARRPRRSISARSSAGKSGAFDGMDADGDHEPVDEPAGLADHVQMAVRDGVEGAGIEGGAGHSVFVAR